MLTTLTYRQDLEWVEQQLPYLISLYDVYRQNVTLTSFGPILQKQTYITWYYTGLSKKMDGIWNRYNLKSTGRIYTFGVLKYSEKFKVLDLL